MSDKHSDMPCFKLQKEFIKCLDRMDKDINLPVCKNILQTYLIKCGAKISKELSLAILATH